MEHYSDDQLLIRALVNADIDMLKELKVSKKKVYNAIALTIDNFNASSELVEYLLSIGIDMIRYLTYVAIRDSNLSALQRIHEIYPSKIFHSPRDVMASLSDVGKFSPSHEMLDYLLTGRFINWLY